MGAATRKDTERFVKGLRRRGVEILLRGDNVDFTGPATDGDIEAIGARKPGLRAFLLPTSDLRPAERIRKGGEHGQRSDGKPASDSLIRRKLRPERISEPERQPEVKDAMAEASKEIKRRLTMRLEIEELATETGVLAIEAAILAKCIAPSCRGAGDRSHGSDR